MGTDDLSSLGLAEKKLKTGKTACRVFVFVLPHSRRECSRAHSFLSVFIWVIRGYLKLSLCLCGSVRGGFQGFSQRRWDTEDGKYRQKRFLKFC